MPKDFKKWFELKPRLNGRNLPVDFYVKQGDIWWCSLGANIAVEIDGKNELYDRPVLVMKIFNIDHVLVIPLSHSKGNSLYYVPIKSMSAESVAVISQMRAISTRRLLRKMRLIVSREDFLNVQISVKNILFT